ncbi:23267_t:CDS:2 [Entrophospora sp. SA101]|nr:23267_t:CDS:2 [Entrophospora sp. SA101]CAJ0863438.1 14658_t:CDS:2 [Entrophospora sp. SA101]
MVKWAATAAGVLTASALMYSFQHKIESNTFLLHTKLLYAKNQLETSLPKNLSSIKNDNNNNVGVSELDQKKSYYYNHEFIPKIKSSWNQNIISLVNNVNKFDINESSKNLYDNLKSFSNEKFFKEKK